MRVFVDTDVVISSLLSKKGAAYLLLHKSKPKKFISSISLSEIQNVVERLGIDKANLGSVVKDNLQVTKIENKINVIKNNYGQFVTDVNDAHIVAGAHLSEANYLITYNIKHYKIDKIKGEFGIIILTPGLFLQYLRSI